MPTFATALLQGLKDHGAREIFGIPGDFALPFFKVIEESGILPLYTLSHEPAVGFAADAAARYRAEPRRRGRHLRRRRLQHRQRGRRRLCRAVAAGRDLGRAGRGASASSGFLLHHQARRSTPRSRVFQEITCDQARLDDPATAPAEIARVLRSAPRALAAGLYRNPARHGRRAVRAGAGRCRRPRPMPRRSPPAPTRCWSACARRSARRSWSTSRCAATASRTRSRSWRGGSAIPVVTSFMGRGLLSTAGDVRCSAPISAPAGDPRASPSGRAARTRCCCSASSCPTPTSRVSRRKHRPAPHDAGDRPRRCGSATTSIPTCRSTRWSMRCSSARTAGARAPAAAARRRLSARAQGRRRADRAVRHRARRSTTCSTGTARCRSPADIGDCLFTAMEIEHDRAGRARLLRRHGLRRAGRHRRCGRRPAGGR